MTLIRNLRAIEYGADGETNIIIDKATMNPSKKSRQNK